FGELYYAKATYLRRNGNPGGWFGDKSRSGGGPLIDLGVHVIDLARYLLGKPKPVSCYGATYQKLFNRPDCKDTVAYKATGAAKEKPICDVEDLATALIRFDNGATIAIEASFALNLKKDVGDIQLFGTKAGCKIDPEVEFFTEENGYLANLTLNRSSALSFDGLFQNEIDHFVDCVVNGIPCRAPAEDGVTLMKILDAVYESARTGHEVVID
ncbi:MAG: Gfo/Idh/MocA family oxidoreductase, partial [Clostridia bacterium]|nr:Gfo/Idh/MocA family oxidoreductase [Clostridia bacterium]